jgi:TonB family protein
MAEAKSALTEGGATRETANDRFKQSFGAWLWASVIVATVLHFGLFAFFPELTASDVSYGVNELETIELPPEVEIPPPPEQITRPASDATKIGDQPVFTPYTVKPELKNRSGAARIVEKYYPQLLKDAGIGGTVQVWVFIDTNGEVENAKVQKGSGNKQLDDAALRAAQEFSFTPALNRDKRVPVWIAIPITFSVRG